MKNSLTCSAANVTAGLHPKMSWKRNLNGCVCMCVSECVFKSATVQKDILTENHEMMSANHTQS